MQKPAKKQLIDRFGRHINYARLSVTDRCDFRCTYCMAEEMQFLPRADILSLEEIFEIAKAMINVGIQKIRLTGGEPLIRNNIMWLIEQLGQIEQLRELTLTTNGSQLKKYAHDLVKYGVKRINVSMDSLNADKFHKITRTGNLDVVLEGIETALSAGFKSIKINSVILMGHNDDEIIELVDYARDHKLDISFIEEMPLGNITEHDRLATFCSSSSLRDIIESQYELENSNKTTNGPSRYVKLKNSSTHIGFISPHSNNFCGDCNRVRVTVEGRLLLCLGNEHSIDLRALIREQGASNEALQLAIENSMAIKPEKHHFNLSDEPDIVRFMNMTGG